MVTISNGGAVILTVFTTGALGATVVISVISLSLNFGTGYIPAVIKVIGKLSGVEVPN